MKKLMPAKEVVTVMEGNEIGEMLALNGRSGHRAVSNPKPPIQPKPWLPNIDPVPPKPFIGLCGFLGKTVGRGGFVIKRS